MSPEDLTGKWSGSFAFPNGLPAAPFTASLVDSEGEISADGQTISGVWKIWNDWSGTFTMRRARGAAKTVTRRTAVGL